MGKWSLTRRYTVVVPPDQQDRLRTFDNRAEGREPWPLGPNRTLRRTGEATFTVRDWSSMGIGKALVTAEGTVLLGPDGVLSVIIRSRNVWFGWLLVACGLACGAMVLRDGPWALALGGGLVAAGWFAILQPSMRKADLAAVEEVLRRELGGEWHPR